MPITSPTRLVVINRAAVVYSRAIEIAWILVNMVSWLTLHPSSCTMGVMKFPTAAAAAPPVPNFIRMQAITIFHA